MTIILDHTIVPAHDKDASARFFAEIFGLSYTVASGHFAPVQVNANLTLDFDDAAAFEAHHYAFYVSDAEFEANFTRIKERGIVYGSDPWSMENRRLNRRRGGRGIYFRDPNGHVLEIMTRPQTELPAS